MALQKKLVAVPFNRGVDTKTADVVLEPGQLDILENGVFEKTGRIQKRNGCASATWEGSASENLQGSYVYNKNIILDVL